MSHHCSSRLVLRRSPCLPCHWLAGPYSAPLFVSTLDRNSPCRACRALPEPDCPGNALAMRTWCVHACHANPCRSSGVHAGPQPNHVCLPMPSVSNPRLSTALNQPTLPRLPRRAMPLSAGPRSGLPPASSPAELSLPNLHRANLWLAKPVSRHSRPCHACLAWFSRI